MVVEGISLLDIPPLRGNPFDLRPIERGRAQEIVGRDKILATLSEHMHSLSPRMMILVGESGSGKTSLINALSSQTSKHFVGHYWNEDNPVERFLSEIAVTFCGHEVPKSINQTIDRLVETLESEKGPLPLIALDYPSEIELSQFLTIVSPMLQRLRSLTIISMTNSQLSNLSDDTLDKFDSPILLEPFTEGEIQLLCDNGIRRMSRGKWVIQPSLLNAVHARTGGNPREVILLLRDLIDEKRGVGSHGALERLIGWKIPEMEASEDFTAAESAIEEDEEGEFENETIQDEQPWSFDYEEIQEQDDPETLVPDENLEYQDEIEPIPEESESITPLEQNDPNENIPISEWFEDRGEAQPVDEKRPPNIEIPPKGFSGLVHRSRDVSSSMPTDPDGTPIQESPQPSFQSQNGNSQFSEKTNSKKEDLPIESKISESQPTSQTGVFSTGGEYWSVDSDFESTLPEKNEEKPPEIIEEHASDAVDQDFFVDNVHIGEETILPEQGIHDQIKPPDPMFDKTIIDQLSDSEKLILSIAKNREISPSDLEIQARLEVGRPRLSQIFNSLHRSGILFVRKEGRNRLFRINEDLVELF